MNSSNLSDWLCNGQCAIGLYKIYKRLDDARKQLQYPETKIIFEEVFNETWEDVIYPLVIQLQKTLPIMLNTVIAQDENIHSLLTWFNFKVQENKDALSFATTVTELVQRPSFDRDMRFMIWVTSNPTRCKRAMRKVR